MPFIDKFLVATTYFLSSDASCILVDTALLSVSLILELMITFNLGYIFFDVIYLDLKLCHSVMEERFYHLFSGEFAGVHDHLLR